MANTKVFILEDENIVAKDIEQSLKKLGYEVVGIASSGEKVKEYLSEGILPDIFLMDIMIKGDMTGIEVAEYVKQHHQLPIIFLTAYADENTLNKAKITEPYGYILKPYKEIDLHTTIEMALYKHQKTSENFRKCPKASERTQMNPNASERVRTCSKLSKTSEDVEKFTKTSRNFAKTA